MIVVKVMRDTQETVNLSNDLSDFAKIQTEELGSTNI